MSKKSGGKVTKVMLPVLDIFQPTKLSIFYLYIVSLPYAFAANLELNLSLHLTYWLSDMPDIVAYLFPPMCLCTSNVYVSRVLQIHSIILAPLLPLYTLNMAESHKK